ncbi:MAG TPA: hypothetical protein VFS73_07770 [Solirubrobacterales bacterium]|jgi:hypothetical protein|nr:hypothetical protein [Solirubrobacterales bacterium]
MRGIRANLTYSNVMSTIAVFGVLAGGSAWAASKIGTNEIEPGAVTAKKLHKNAVTTKKIKDDAVTGDKAKESSFGRVPDAAHADDATKLDGQPASDYRLHCPGDLDRAGDLCYEVDTRPAASYAGALKACALDQRRLPDAGELALVFDHLSAQQPYQWTVGYFTDGVSLAPVLGQTSSRDLLVTANSLPGNTAFRCVTSATN